LLLFCHRAQFVTLPAPRLARVERHFAARFGRALQIDPQIENGTLGAGSNHLATEALRATRASRIAPATRLLRLLRGLAMTREATFARTVTRDSRPVTRDP
jgi:hypothetical protein